MTLPTALPEWSHQVLIAQLADTPFAMALVADENTRGNLAKRFDLLALDGLEADVTLARQGENVELLGRLRAQATQACALSGQGVMATLDEPVKLTFMPDRADQATPNEEIELAADDCDIVWHDGRVVDVAEAISQSLGLALDPYPRAPNADDIARAAGIKREEEAGAFGALAALKAQMEGRSGR